MVFSCGGGEVSDAHTSAEVSPSGVKASRKNDSVTYDTPWGTIKKKEVIQDSDVWIPAIADESNAAAPLAQFLAGNHDKYLCDLFYGDGSYDGLQDSMARWDRKDVRNEGLVNADFDLTYWTKTGSPALSFKLSSEYMSAYPSHYENGVVFDLNLQTPISLGNFVPDDEDDVFLAILQKELDTRVKKVLSDNGDQMDAGIRQQLSANVIARDELDRKDVFFIDDRAKLHVFHSVGLPHVVSVYEPDPWYVVAFYEIRGLGKDLADKYLSVPDPGFFGNRAWGSDEKSFFFEHPGQSFTVNTHGYEYRGAYSVDRDFDYKLSAVKDENDNIIPGLEEQEWKILFASLDGAQVAITKNGITTLTSLVYQGK